MAVDACVGLGSNVGDRRAHLQAARDAMAALPGTALIAFSSVHETEPVGVSGQGLYLNAAARLRTELDSRDLLEALMSIERAEGRQRSAGAQRWGPRTLDLDLLLYGDRVIEGPGLIVPHPRMHQRAFVLAPLSEVAPEMRHPVLDMSIEELAARV